MNQSYGSFVPNPNFCYFDNITHRELVNMPPIITKLGLQSALGEAERHRLVRASKSQTRQKAPEKPVKRDLSTYEPIIEIPESLPAHRKESKGPGQYTVIDFREWSDEWRIRTRVDTSMLQPSAPDGPRESVMLSDAGARKLADSCHYMALKKGGYRTFVTGTFNPESRAAISDGKTTIQKEVTRCMDAMKKMFLRGWYSKAGDYVAPGGGEFCYSWVVEIPKNEDGSDNPHVHMLMNWRVEKELFLEWSARIESIWGHGYFHLERIKDPLCAGAYMAKAAGYMTKGAGDENQGLVRGNRYGISKPARAPGWCNIGNYELGVMGRLIADIHDHLTHKHGEDYAKRKQLNADLQAAKKGSRTRREIGEKLQKVRAKLNALPVRASKYQMVIKGSKYLNRFIGWAQGNGWSHSKRPDSLWYSRVVDAIQRRRERRRLAAMRMSEFEWIRAIKYYFNWMPVEREPMPWSEYEAIVI